MNALEEDQQQDDHQEQGFKSYKLVRGFIYFPFPLCSKNTHDQSNVISNPVNSKALHSTTKNMTSVKHKTTCMFSNILMSNVPCFEFDFTKCIFFPWKGTVLSRSYSPFDFSTDSLRHTEIQIQQIKEMFERQIKDEAELFNQMNSSENKLDLFVPGSGMQSILNYYHNKNGGTGKQYAFAFAFGERNKYKFFKAIYPHHGKKQVTKHCEEILAEKIDKSLQKNRDKFKYVLMYTENSPCLRREGKSCPCMYKLLESLQWHKEYRVFTHVIFTKCWGLSGPNYSKHLTDSTILDPHSHFYPYVKICEKIPFKLWTKDFKKDVQNIYGILSSVEKHDRQRLKTEIKSALEKLFEVADGSLGLSDEHLEHGMKEIRLFTFDPKVQDKISKILIKTWKEMVIKSSVLPVRAKITADYNIAVVQCFNKVLKSSLGDCRPLQLFMLRNQNTHN
ncbi:uncharacterized protein LOC121611629 isoform X2 [Chelmon rostratus]|nr:uncharacterized protein LOC121611629 isoform X2 [Chelmon rostratus]